MPALDKRDAAKLIARRHPEYARLLALWGELADAFEGGAAYRDRVLGTDRAGYPRHYLVRHKREYPAPGEWPAHASPLSLAHAGVGGLGAALAPAAAPDDDFEMRRARTPVPDFVAEVVRKHLGRLYAREVRREGNPTAYDEWAADVDGRGTSVDRWARHELAPLLYVLGTLDVLCDHPAPPEGETVATDADRRRLGLSRVVARVVQPHDVLWWRLNPDGSYAEVVDREWHEGEPGEPPVERFRHWTAEEWALYGPDGEAIGSGEHAYGRVPQVRLTVGTRHRYRAIGATPLERAAQIQREYYNRDSELILSDVVQAHPTLEGPPPEPGEAGTVAVGPGWLLEKAEFPRGSGNVVGHSVVDFPKGGAESIRLNLAKLRDELDRTYALAKPAGSAAGGGSGGSVVAQSGVSKGYDAATLNDILGELADTLADAETHVGRLVMAVAEPGWEPADGADISVVYPKQFDLFAADELAERWLGCLELAREGRDAPEATGWVVGAIVRNYVLPGRSDADYERIDEEVRAVMAAAGGEDEGDGGGADLPDFDPDDPDSYADDPGDDFDDDPDDEGGA